jgi:UTP-glucose-1-phosphate uridylyltransferase
MQRTLVILAAGMGSRYGGLKQIDPVGQGGETIMDYSVYDAMRAGFDKLVFVIRRDIERPFKESVGSRFEQRLAVDYVYQELDRLPAGLTPPPSRQKPWGTGQAILITREAVHEPFAVINADDFYGAASFRLLAAQLASASPDFAMVGFVLRNTLSEFGSVARGVCRVTPDGLLESVTELTKIEKAGTAAKYTDAAGVVHTLTGDEVVSMNMWGFTPALFDPLEQQFAEFLRERCQDDKAEFYIPTVVNTLLARGQARLRVLPTPDSWIGITYREDRPTVVAGIRRLIDRGDYPEKLWR